MANFEKCVDWVLRLEDSTLSGKVVNLGDGGGLTRFGITSTNHPELLYGRENYEPSFFSTLLPSEQALTIAKECYRTDYWNRIQGDVINSNLVAATLLSFAVNDGVTQAVRELQRCLVDIPQTGFFGSRTLAAVNASVPEYLAGWLRSVQIEFYRNLVLEHLDKARFLKGWLNRANAVFTE